MSRRVLVKLTHTYEYNCWLDIESNDDARSQIEALHFDDFRETESYQNVEVLSRTRDITGDIQPSTPNLNP